MASQDALTRPWRDIDDLAERMLDRARRRMQVTLSPDTATLVALKLRMADAKPAEREIAAIICRQPGTCAKTCYSCRGKANEIVRLYGMKYPGRLTPVVDAPDEQPGDDRTIGELREWNLVVVICRDCREESTVLASDLRRKMGHHVTFGALRRCGFCAECKSKRIRLDVRNMPR